MFRWSVALSVGCLLALAQLAAQSHQHVATGPVPIPRGVVAPVGPPVLENTSTTPHTVEVTITASPSEVSLMPGATTPVYAYNGRVPGPMLDVQEGDRVTIHFRNDLPEPTTVHWHGLHIPAASDGSPFYPIAPGQRHDYVFTIPAGSAGTYWYHPHPDQTSGSQIARGLTAPSSSGPPTIRFRRCPSACWCSRTTDFSATDRSTGRIRARRRAWWMKSTAAKATCCSSTGRSCRRSRFAAGNYSAGASSMPRPRASSAWRFRARRSSTSAMTTVSSSARSRSRTSWWPTASGSS